MSRVLDFFLESLFLGFNTSQLDVIVPVLLHNKQMVRHLFEAPEQGRKPTAVTRSNRSRRFKNLDIRA
jgi:hypothetical protein